VLLESETAKPPGREKRKRERGREKDSWLDMADLSS
jgi:hypothetical protein